MGSRCRQNIAWWARAIRKIIITVMMVWGSQQRSASFSLDNYEITHVDFLFLWSLLWFPHSTSTCIHPILFFFQNVRMAWIRSFGTSIVLHNVFKCYTISFLPKFQQCLYYSECIKENDRFCVSILHAGYCLCRYWFHESVIFHYHKMMRCESFVISVCCMFCAKQNILKCV